MRKWGYILLLAVAITTMGCSNAVDVKMLKSLQRQKRLIQKMK